MTSRAMAIAFSFLLASPLALPNFNLASGKGGGGGGSGSSTRIRVEADLDPVANLLNGEGSSKYEKEGTKEQFEATVEIPFAFFSNNLTAAQGADVRLNITGSISATCSLQFDEIEPDLELGIVAEYKVVIQRNGGLPFPKKGFCSTDSDGQTAPLVLPVVIEGDMATATLDDTDILMGTFQNH